MRVFDASSIIYAWDNYPPDQFPPLWDWLAGQVEKHDIALSTVALEEVAHKLPECADWLVAHDVLKLSVTNDVLKEAMKIKSLLGIAGDSYHVKGVDENDLIIIATAKCHSVDLVSNENAQKLPDKPAKRKIPAVCVMPDVGVTCSSFLEYLKASKAKFGN